MSYNIRSYLSAHTGLNLTSPVQAVGKAEADDCLNVWSRKDNDLESRRGFQVKAKDVGGYGLTEYKYLDDDQREISTVFLLGDSLYEVKAGTFTIAYNGAYPQATLKIIVDAGVIKLILNVNNADVLTSNLGKGYDETSIVTLANTKTAIEAISGFTVTISGVTTTPSAFLDIVPLKVISKGLTGIVGFYYIEEVKKHIAVPFDGLQILKDSANLHNIRTITHKNRLICCDGGIPKVYDGHSLYYAGMPTPEAPHLDTVGGGTLGRDYDEVIALGGENTYYYYYNYTFVDNRGYTTNGPLSPAAPITLDGSGTKITVLVETLQDISGYNTHGAIVDGNQSLGTIVGSIDNPVSTNIAVESATNTLVVGDSAAFISRETVTACSSVDDQTFTNALGDTNIKVVSLRSDITLGDTLTFANRLDSNNLLSYTVTAISADRTVITLYVPITAKTFKLNKGDLITIVKEKYVSYEITAATSTQLTVAVIEKVTLTISDGDAISNNLFINIYRVDPNTSTTIKYLVKTFINNPANSQLLFTDDDNNPTEKINFTDPLLLQASPPEADFCISYKDTLMLAKGDTLYFNSVDDPLTTSDFNFNLTSNFLQFNHAITGLGISGDYLIVFTKNVIYSVVGRDIYSINRTTVTEDIGCISHESIVNVGGILYFLDTTGVYAIQGNQVVKDDSETPTNLATKLGMFFENLQTTGTYLLNQSATVYDPLNNLILYFIPNSIGANPNYASPQSICLAYNYKRQAWFFWNNLNFIGGAIRTSDGRLLWSERAVGNGIRTNFMQRLELDTEDDYCDHVTAIERFYDYKWDSLGENSADKFSMGTYKKVVKLRIYAGEKVSRDYGFTPTFTVMTYRDYSNKLVHTVATKTFSFGGTAFPIRWNDQPFGGWRSPLITANLMPSHAEALKTRIYNNEIKQNFNISAVEILWAPIYDKDYKE